MAETLQDVRTPLGGRAHPSVLKPGTARVFGQWADATGPRNADVATESVWAPEIDEDCKEDRLWLVTSYTYEVVRETVNGGIQPIPRSSIPQPATGGFAGTSTRRSLLGLRLVVGGLGGERRYDVDAGQSIPVWGRSLRVYGLMTDGMVEIKGDEAVPNANSFVCDALLAVRILKVESYNAHDWNMRTLYLAQAADTATVGIEIPPGAFEVELYQSTHGNASVEWSASRGSPATATTPLHAIPWIPGARKTEPIQLCGNETFLVPDTDVDNARRFVAKFKIRP